MDVGIDLDAENLPEVLTELRQLQATFPRYYTPDDKEYAYITSRIATLITELPGWLLVNCNSFWGKKP